MIDTETQTDKIEEKIIKINLICKWCWAKYDVIRLPTTTSCIEGYGGAIEVVLPEGADYSKPLNFDFVTMPCRRCCEEIYYKGYEDGRRKR